MSTKQYRTIKRKLRRKTKENELLLSQNRQLKKGPPNILICLWLILIPLGGFQLGHLVVKGVAWMTQAEVTEIPVFTQWTTTIIPSATTVPDDEMPALKIIDSFAEGACVDRVLAVLTIIERDNKLDDTIFVGLGGKLGRGYHVQCVKIEKDGTKHYLDLNDNFDVIYGSSDFVAFGLTEEYLYVKPDIFRKAAMKFTPDMTYIQFRDFYKEYNEAIND